MNLLQLDGISAGYDEVPILRDVSLAIKRGEIVSLIGRNGVGKTTLMKTIIGLVSPTAGQIMFEGTEITDATPEERGQAGIGYVPQGREVFPRLTVEENLRVGTQVNKANTTHLFEEVYRYFPRLEERKEQKAGTMSGGEQQMLAIGRALVGNPDLLLLDEASEGIQPSIIDEISDAVQEINADLGITVFFTEQHLDFTVTTSERCYVMEKGQIVNELSAENLENSEVVQEYITLSE